MNIHKISSAAFKGKFYPPTTPEWKSETGNDKKLSQTAGELSNFVGKKLEAWVKVSLNYDPAKKTVNVVAKNDKRKERALTTSYTLRDFIEHRESLKERLVKNVN